MQLDEMTIGWKTLAKILDLIRKAVNSNDPLQGHGITVSKTPSGTVISVEPKTSDDNANQPTAGTGGSSGGTLQQITAFDLSGNAIVLNVYTDGNPPTSGGLQWIPVNTVTPPSCAPQTITLLTKGQTL